MQAKFSLKYATLLVFGELLIRFAYWGIQGVLVLYAITQQHLPRNEAYILYGSFTAASFAMSIIGGYLADKFLGRFLTVSIGIILTVFGNMLIAFGYFTTGLAIVSSGIGIFLPNNVNIFGEYVKDKAPTSEQKAFGYYYSAINFGALLGPVIYGYVYKHFNMDIAFYFAAALALVWWGIVFLNRHNVLARSPNKTTIQVATGIVITALSVIVVLALLHNTQAIRYILVFLGIALCCYYVKIYLKNTTLRHALLQIAAGTIASLIFFSFAFQVGTSLLILGAHHVHNTVLGHQFPSSIYVSLEPLFVVIFSPLVTTLFSRKHLRNWTLFSRSGMGLFVCGISFGLAYILCTDILQEIPLLPFLLVFAIMGLAETIIVPPLFAKIASDLPANLKSTIMGMMYLFFSFSSYTAGIIATNTSSNGSDLSGYTATYSEITIFSLVAAAILILFSVCTATRVGYGKS